jgi:transposase
MMRPSESVQVYVCTEPVDFRKSINGLASIVEGELLLNVFEAYLFVFCNRRRDKLKVLYWERNGFCLWYKRLEKQRFWWPRDASDSTLLLSGRELNWLLDGYNLSRLQPHQRLSYQTLV